MRKARQNGRKLEENPGFGRPGKQGTPSGTKWSSERQHFARFHEGKLERAAWWNFEGEQETHAGSQKNPKGRQKSQKPKKKSKTSQKNAKSATKRGETRKTLVFGRPGKPGAPSETKWSSERHHFAGFHERKSGRAAWRNFEGELENPI